MAPPSCALLSLAVGLAGGAKVLDGLGRALKLDDRALAPSRAVLHDYGKSYVLAYLV
jgi:predicted naringenin-chalcone synthase